MLSALQICDEQVIHNVATPFSPPFNRYPQTYPHYAQLFHLST